MTKEKTKGNQITEGIIWQQLLFFFFPILFGTFFQQLYNAADAMIVGRFVGKEALSAVGGSTSMLTQLIVGFFVGLSSGASVIVSQYSSSYGNYVVISHGSGNTTLYAHMSSRKVEVGQYVNQGDVIGITGSTGNSTGPHLHFEVTENGVRVNPLNDGAEPKMGYLTGYTLSKSA